MARDINNLVNRLQENAMLTGKELEFSLIGPSAAEKYDPEKMHNGKAEKNIRDFNEAAAIVKGEIHHMEDVAETVEEDNPKFKYAEITTHPESPFAYGLYTELCKLLEYEDIDSKQIRFYNTLDTILDIRFGTDFMITVDPFALKESKFGPGVHSIRKPFDITVDLTANTSKSHAKANVVLQYEKLADSKEERLKWGREAALKIAEAIVNRVRFLSHRSDPIPFEKELKDIEKKAAEEREAPKSHGPVSSIRKGVIKRVKSVEGGKEV